jgi:hypothetical protein
MPMRKQAGMQPRRQAGGHAANGARDHRQDGPWFAGQATRGKPDPAGCLDLHRFRFGQVLILGGPLFEGHG